MYWLVVTLLVQYSLCEHTDGGKAPRIPLNDGHSIPALGLGTFLGFDKNGQKPVLEGEVEIPVSWALDAGYRLIDSASAYMNEDQVGTAIRKSPVPREDIFVVTKLGTSQQRHVVDSLRESLRRLNLTYVDLYLIHFPITFTPDRSAYDNIDYVDTWKSMEEAQNLGLARSIGVSNFNVSQIERLLRHSQVKPAVLQVEVNLNMAQPTLLQFCKSHGIVMMGYSPFGRMFSQNADLPPPRADDATLKTLAEKYQKTVTQIALRYLVQLGVVPIPKSVHKNRLEQNIDIFDFELTSEEMKTLGKFNKNYRTVLPSVWQDHPYYPFEQSDGPINNPFKPKKN